ncbi:MAG TPA: hypothetical protein VMF67_11055 [Rhizomicrobium sp.]|nr:hypothetical protein [Rhizomicrobium sp.]
MAPMWREGWQEGVGAARPIGAGRIQVRLLGHNVRKAASDAFEQLEVLANRKVRAQRFDASADGADVRNRFRKLPFQLGHAIN